MSKIALVYKGMEIEEDAALECIDGRFYVVHKDNVAISSNDISLCKSWIDGYKQYDESNVTYYYKWYKGSGDIGIPARLVGAEDMTARELRSFWPVIAEDRNINLAECTLKHIDIKMGGM